MATADGLLSLSREVARAPNHQLAEPFWMLPEERIRFLLPFFQLAAGSGPVHRRVLRS